MNKILTLILTLLVTLHSSGQNFEGQVTYSNTYKSKLSNITDQQWTSMLGSTVNYFIKGGNYRSSTNGTMVVWQLYINSDNRLYNKIAGSETILWNDGASNQDEVLKADLRENVTEILGYQCDELVLTCKSGVQKYYFAPEHKVESSLFTKHKFGNWSEYITRAKALPLKMVMDNSQFTLECVATEVKPATLEDALFVLPADAKISKSPY